MKCCGERDSCTCTTISFLSILIEKYCFSCIDFIDYPILKNRYMCCMFIIEKVLKETTKYSKYINEGMNCDRAEK